MSTMTTTTVPPDVQPQAATKSCRFCRTGLQRTFVDLGMSPLCETYPSAADLTRGEVYYPLHVYVCEQCFLVQLEQYESPEEIFSDYAYFSTFSDSWLEHCDKYCGDQPPAPLGKERTAGSITRALRQNVKLVGVM